MRNPRHSPVLGIIVCRAGLRSEVVALHHDGRVLVVLRRDGELGPVRDRHVESAQRCAHLANIHLCVARPYRQHHKMLEYLYLLE